MNIFVDMISGVGWMLFHELHEEHKDMPGPEFVKLFEQTYHCRVGYIITEATDLKHSMKEFYMEFTPENFTWFQLKYGDHPQHIAFMPKEWFSDN